MRILLVRHGQSEWNATGRWQGWADPPLTALGRRQARLAAAEAEGIEDGVSSDLQRASETAALMAEAFALVPAAPDERLRERDVGQWTGLTRAQIRQRWPDALATMEQPPGGEDAATLERRVLAAVNDLARSYPDSTVLAVTHGGTIRCVERHLGVEPAPLPNLGGTWLEIADDAVAVSGPRVLLVDPDEVAVTVPRQL